MALGELCTIVTNMSRSWGEVQPRKRPTTDGRSLLMAAMQKQSE